MKKFITLSAMTLVAVFIFTLFLGKEGTEVEVSTKEEVISQFENNETFLLVIGGSTCHWCTKYKEETLPYYIEENQEFPLYFTYADTEFYGSDDLKNFLDEYELTYNASPTSYLIVDGQLVATKEGYLSLSKLKGWINENK